MRVRFGGCTFDDQVRELVRDGVAVPLSPKAFHLLRMLIEVRPQPVSRESLYEALWPDVIVEPGNLHGLISEIRTAIGDGGHEIIRTVHRVGYAFTDSGATEETTRYAIVLGNDEIALHPGENVIGRDPRDAISIHSPEVSRHHAKLTVTGSVVMLEDLGSKNGTFIGTRRITAPVAVVSGDEILVGTIRMRLIQLDALAPTATVG